MKIRTSIPLLLFIFLFVSFGGLTYFNYTNEVETKTEYHKINQKRIMDKLTTRLRNSDNYENILTDIVREDEYINELNAFTLDKKPLTKDSILIEKYKDLFTKTIRSTGATSPFPTKDNKYIYMRIDPDRIEENGDEVIIRAKLDNESETIFSKYFMLIINAGVGLVTIILLVLLSIIFISIGFGGLRKFVPKIPFAIHRGKIDDLKIKGEKEMLELANTFERTAIENDKLYQIISNTALSENKDDLINKLHYYFEKEGMDSFTILYKSDMTYKTLAIRGKWQNPELMKSYTIEIDKLLENSNSLLYDVVYSMTYVEVDKNSESNFEPKDVELLGSPSIYLPIAVNNEVVAIIGGYGRLSNEAKKMIILLTTKWRNILHRFIKEYSSFKETNQKVFKSQQKRVIDRINEETEKYNQMYKDGAVLFKKGKYDESLDKFVPLLNHKNYRKNAKLLKVIGTAYFKVGDYEKACKYWEQCLDINPSEPSVKNFLKRAKSKL